VLVHVERQDRNATGQGIGVIGRPLMTRLPSRGRKVSSTQPEPPPRALPIATNSERHRSTLPKLASSASAIAGILVWPSPPREPKYSSCSRIEFVATSSSRLRPFSWKPGTLAKSKFASWERMAFSRFTAPL
jgi:hypothetical protein